MPMQNAFTQSSFNSTKRREEVNECVNIKY